MTDRRGGWLETTRVRVSFMWIFSALMALLFLSASVGISVHDHTFRQPSIGFPMPYFVALLALLVACFLKNRTTLLPMPSAGVLVVVGTVLLAAMSSSVVNVDRAQAAINVLVLQAATFCLFIYVLFTLRRAGVDPLLYFLRFLIVFGLASLAFAIVLFVRGRVGVGFATIEQFPGYMRLYGWYGNPNLFGSTMGVATLAAYAMLMQGKSIKLGRALVFVCLFAGVLLSGSKAVLASIVATIGFVHLVGMLPARGSDSPLPQKSWKLTAFGTVAVLAFMPVFIVFYGYFEELLKFDNPDITSGRIDLWRQSMEFFASGGNLKILFGNGLNSHMDALGFSAHSFYIRSLVEEGVIFILIFFLLNILVLYILIKSCLLYNKNINYMANFVLLITLFMLLRNFATPSFFQIRIENLAYLYCICLFFYFWVPVSDNRHSSGDQRPDGGMIKVRS